MRSESLKALPRVSLFFHLCDSLVAPESLFFSLKISNPLTRKRVQCVRHNEKDPHAMFTRDLFGSKELSTLAALIHRDINVLFIRSVD